MRRFGKVQMCLGSLAILGSLCAPSSGAPIAGVVDDARARAAGTTTYQQRVLADGFVTEDEYRDSTWAVVRCLRRSRAARLRVDDPKPAPGGELEFEFAIEPDEHGEAGVAVERIYDACHERYADDVHAVYANQRVVPEDARGAETAKLIACLRRAGVRIADRASLPAIAQLVEASSTQGALDCVRSHWDLFRLPVFVNDHAG